VRVPIDARVALQTIQIVALFPSMVTKWPKSLLSLYSLFSVTVSFHLSLIF
jgi:hypothetical protein